MPDWNSIGPLFLQAISTTLIHPNQTIYLIPSKESIFERSKLRFTKKRP